MGKLGGRELNYASDVDVLFVHDGDMGEAEHAARAVLSNDDRAQHPTASCSAPTPTSGPGGRAGALSRTLDVVRRRIGNAGLRPGSSRH